MEENIELRKMLSEWRASRGNICEYGPTEKEAIKNFKKTELRYKAFENYKQTGCELSFLNDFKYIGQNNYDHFSLSEFILRYDLDKNFAQRYSNV